MLLMPGPWRPKLGVQRGSLQYMSLCEGDPGRHYLPGGSQEACGYDETDLIPTIPVLPISWGDAVPLLNRLEGKWDRKKMNKLYMTFEKLTPLFQARQPRAHLLEH